MQTQEVDVPQGIPVPQGLVWVPRGEWGQGEGSLGLALTEETAPSTPGPWKVGHAAFLKSLTRKHPEASRDTLNSQPMRALVLSYGLRWSEILAEIKARIRVSESQVTLGFQFSPRMPIG